MRQAMVVVASYVPTYIACACKRYRHLSRVCQKALSALKCTIVAAAIDLWLSIDVANNEHGANTISISDVLHEINSDDSFDSGMAAGCNNEVATYDSDSSLEGITPYSEICTRRLPLYIWFIPESLLLHYDVRPQPICCQMLELTHNELDICSLWIGKRQYVHDTSSQWHTDLQDVFLHCMSDMHFKSIKVSYLANGVVPRVHGN